MSYILDALKKADAERERGTVPGLHSQPQGQAEDEADAPRRMPPAVWMGAGVGLCLIAVLSWQLLARGPVASQAAPGPASPGGAVAPEPGPQAQAPSAQQPVQAPPVPPTQGQAEAPYSVPGDNQRAATIPAPQMPPPTHGTPPAQPPLAAARPQSPVVPPAHVPVTQPAAQGTAPRDTPAATHKEASAPPARIPNVSELPDDIRRDLPQLVIGGAMYSDTPSNRMLVVNSQVFHEGDQPYQGLVLEEIRLKSAVFKYRGYRYAIQY